MKSNKKIQWVAYQWNGVELRIGVMYRSKDVLSFNAVDKSSKNTLKMMERKWGETLWFCYVCRNKNGKGEGKQILK